MGIMTKAIGLAFLKGSDSFLSKCSTLREQEQLSILPLWGVPALEISSYEVALGCYYIIQETPNMLRSKCQRSVVYLQWIRTKNFDKSKHTKE
jgi:tRNA(Ile)-lysidine synthase TilS/MesJ